MDTADQHFLCLEYSITKWEDHKSTMFSAFRVWTSGKKRDLDLCRRTLTTFNTSNSYCLALITVLHKILANLANKIPSYYTIIGMLGSEREMADHNMPRTPAPQDLDEFIDEPDEPMIKVHAGLQELLSNMMTLSEKVHFVMTTLHNTLSEAKEGYERDLKKRIKERLEVQLERCSKDVGNRRKDEYAKEHMDIYMRRWQKQIEDDWNVELDLRMTTVRTMTEEQWNQAVDQILSGKTTSIPERILLTNKASGLAILQRQERVAWLTRGRIWAGYDDFQVRYEQRMSRELRKVERAIRSFAVAYEKGCRVPVGLKMTPELEHVLCDLAAAEEEDEHVEETSLWPAEEQNQQQDNGEVETMEVSSEE